MKHWGNEIFVKKISKLNYKEIHSLKVYKNIEAQFKLI